MSPTPEFIAALPTVINGTVPGAPEQWCRGLQLVLFPDGETPQPPRPLEMWTALFFFVCWASLRKVLFKTVLVPGVKHAGAADDGVHDYKCAVLVWNGLFHTWSTVWLMHWLPQRRWYWDTVWVWENIQQGAHAVPMELEAKVFYMLQLGYHLQSFLWHMPCLEERRPDFATMAVHHAATLLLIIGSWLRGYIRIGLLVLLVHDASDIWVCACKATHMCNMKRASHALFVVMVGTWAYYRLWLYPSWVIWSVWTYPDIWGAMWWIFTGLMCVLLVLHFWWFHLFIKMAAGIAKHGVGQGKDLTENKEVAESLAREKDAADTQPVVMAYDAEQPAGDTAIPRRKGCESA